MCTCRARQRLAHTVEKAVHIEGCPDRAAREVQQRTGRPAGLMGSKRALGGPPTPGAPPVESPQGMRQVHSPHVSGTAPSDTGHLSRHIKRGAFCTGAVLRSPDSMGSKRQEVQRGSAGVVRSSKHGDCRAEKRQNKGNAAAHQAGGGGRRVHHTADPQGPQTCRHALDPVPPAPAQSPGAELRHRTVR